MRKLVILAVVLMLLFVTGVVAAQDETYVVQPGDTLAGIARAYDIDIDAILIRNGIIDPTRIVSGQTLIIPTGALTIPQTHVVQPGENLTAIASRYQTTVDALVEANRLGNTRVYPGQVLDLPAIGGAATFARTYLIEIGDTLRSISEEFGVTWEQIATYNNIANPNLIYAGMVITIPPVDFDASQFGQGGAVVPQPQRTGIPQYVVQQGDTLYAIAVRFNTTLEALREINGIGLNHVIFAGDVLDIPPTGGPVTAPPVVVTPRSTVNGYYYVRPGDTLFAISRSFNVNIYTIAQSNGLLNLNAIYSGQALRIPGY